MKPTIGRIVVYNTTELDRNLMREVKANVQIQLPAIIVATFENSSYQNNESDLKVLLDGVGELWGTSIPQGDGEGQWNFPVIVKEELKNAVDIKQEVSIKEENKMDKIQNATVKDDSKTK